MILQALNQYYKRLRDEGGDSIPQFGFTVQPIHYAIVLRKNGELIGIKDIRNYTDKKPKPVELIVPEVRVTSGKPKKGSTRSNFLWGNTGYVLGIDDKGRPENSEITWAAFKELHHQLCEKSKDHRLIAVLEFLDNWNPKRKTEIVNWNEILETKGNLVFRLEDEKQFIHECSEPKTIWTDFKKENISPITGHCLVLGRSSPILPTHPKIKERSFGSFGASLVSFNEKSYESYGKEQNYNAPIGEEAAFAYTTALNHLLRFGSKQKMLISDATTVFWTERKSRVESIWGELFNPSNTESSDAKEIHQYLSAVREGKKPPDTDTSIKMYVLGLSPNASRLAVRFWMVDTVEAFDKHLGNHLNNLRIQKQYENEKEFPGIWQLLIETLPKKKELRKTENINRLLAGALTRSILSGGRYPESLLAAIISRIRADGEVSYYRAAQIKAVLKRNHTKEVSMALDEGNTHVAYRLGRLFAVLEKAQEEAIPNANATIKDRFFGSASATPGIVFPLLLQRGQHNLSKIGEGSRIAKEKLIQSIADGITEFPRHLPLEEQGLFCLGYYHQRNAFFQKKASAENAASN